MKINSFEGFLVIVVLTIWLMFAWAHYKRDNPTPMSDERALYVREQHNKVWVEETRVAEEDDGMCGGLSLVRAGNVDLVGSCGPRLNLIQGGPFSYGF